MQKIILASNNAKKVSELSALLKSHHFSIVPQGTLQIAGAEETGLTFVENALLKARHASQKSGLPAIADDSGLVVDALDGGPGLYSARYAGESASDRDNNQKLLTALQGVGPGDRTAHFHCTLVYLQHYRDPDPIICQGHWHGTILDSPRGNNGFGYDPLFWVSQHNCSAAELSADTKGQLSHRGMAMAKLTERLASQKFISGRT